ncbi:MAG: hypothetical protein JWP75_1591 [Frondihabitans sp.]|nr:hypothetical protein [Frondihabitans sp.]
MQVTRAPIAEDQRARIATWAKRRLFWHLVSAGAAVAAAVAFESRTDGPVDTWIGYCLLGLAIMYSGLGVSILKQSIASLRTEKGDIRDEPVILATARALAARDGLLVGAALGLTLIALPLRVQAGPALLAVTAITLADFVVRQFVLRRRMARGDRPKA